MTFKSISDMLKKYGTVLYSPQAITFLLSLCIKERTRALKAEFENHNNHRCWRRLVLKGGQVKKDDCKDERHYWTHAQWVAEARRELEEGKSI